MRITLAEARLILETKEKELRTLFDRREECKTNTYKKINGAKELTHEEHEFSVDDLSNQIETSKKEIRKLRLLTTVANVQAKVDFVVEDETITLQEAIYLIKQYRDELPYLEELGELKSFSEFIDPTLRFAQNAVDRSYEQVTEPTFDTKLYRKKAQKIQKLITKLELAITKTNFTEYVEVDFLTDEIEY